MSTISPDFPNHSQSNMKPMKLDMGWLAMVERFMEYHEVTKHQKVIVAAMHLGGDNALWM
ncbi:unnamed protein product [Prunus armeniaca]|uniref:Uncharacterized protein n=1 Tax=Prunus armeniaca TaxID=36596 RepID=A0A6J5X7J3_PRUAR|nr:unnamed protein product [Prunus armeniaca]